MTRTMDVSIEINGSLVYTGRISGDERDGASFQYADSYLKRADAAAISLSLPLRREAFGIQETKNFFEGLLPEGFTRKSVARWMNVNEKDYLSILAGLGNECLGAIRIADTEKRNTFPGYKRLSHEEVAGLAREGAIKSAEIVTKSHLSLTGASGKVGLYYDEENGAWYLPVGEAPSTHIVKQSHIRLDGLVTNEQLCLLTAKKLGIEVPESFIINTGNSAEDEILFATRRYDRIFQEAAGKIDGLRRPLRLHQEDFAQAMGVAAADKYEAAGGDNFEKVFKLLSSCSSNPLEDQLKLWDILVFDYLVGNTDNHIKNLSLLYGKDLKAIRLAPAYDIVSTAIYESSTRDMAIAVNGKLSLDAIDRNDYFKEAEKAGIYSGISVRHFDYLAQNFKNALQDSAAQLTADGFYSAEDLCRRILMRGGIARL